MWIDRQSEVKEKGNQQDRFPGLQKESIYNTSLWSKKIINIKDISQMRR